MRARMTLALVLALTPLLVLTSGALSVMTRWSQVADENLVAAKVAEASVHDLSQPDWRAKLQTLFDQASVRGHRIGAVVVEGKAVVWSSASNAPAWPGWNGGHVREYDAGPRKLIVGQPMMMADPSHIASMMKLSLFAVVGGAILVWCLVGKVLSPIRRLAKQADQASIDGSRVTLESPSRDAEMVGLVDTLNGLLNRVSETAAAKGRFYAAASHELRTPLQALSGHLELALRRPRSEADYEAVVREAHEQTRRLIGLAEGLLLLHQLDGAASAEQLAMNLSEVVTDQAAEFADQFSARSLEVGLALREDAWIEAIPTHAEVLVRNLLENAAKYGDTGSRVEIAIQEVDSGFVLEIRNRCSEPLGNDEKWFEPFSRRDASRAGKTGGNGLGLAICQAIAETNRWRLDVKREDGLFVASVRFPRLRAGWSLSLQPGQELAPPGPVRPKGRV